MRIIIKDREEYIHFVKYHYCEKCGHYRDCPMSYLCPPLDEEWNEEEKYRQRFDEE